MMNIEGNVPGKLYIVDDIFPHPRSIDTWRGIEFISYLEMCPETIIYSTMQNIGLLDNMSKLEVMEQFRAKFPQFKERVFELTEDKFIELSNATMVYMVFLNNAWANLFTMETYNIPFVFELYPGGGFALNNDESDKKLRAIMNSPWFRGVIVTSKVTYNYLINNNFCMTQKVVLVSGCVYNPKLEYKKKKLYYGPDKDTFDIAFASYRYSEKGQDKGYDIFIDVAKELYKRSKKFRFHVIGNYDENVIDVGELKGNIYFYGIQNEDWFQNFYYGIDVFLSPNRSSILSNGSFDGFPTGCGIDAITQNVVLMATDGLQQNNDQYIDNQEMYIIPINVAVIVDKIMLLYNRPDILNAVGLRGGMKSRKLYSFKTQMVPRQEFLKRILLECCAEEEHRAFCAKKAQWEVQQKFNSDIQNLANVYNNLLIQNKQLNDEMKNLKDEYDKLLNQYKYLSSDLTYMKKHRFQTAINLVRKKI